MNRILIWTAFLSSSLALACAAPTVQAPPDVRDPVPVHVLPVTGADGGWVEVPGTVEATQSANLASRLAAVIEELPVEEGDRVTQGEIIIRLDGRDLRARLRAAEASMQAALAHRDRVRNLFAKQAATQQEVDAAEAEAAGAQAEFDAARVQLQYVEMRAPFDGRVTDKRVRAGDLATPGQTLITVHGDHQLRLAATVSGNQAKLLKRGDEISAVRDDGSVVTTRISVISPAGDPASRRFLIKSDLPRDARERAGAFMRLRLPHDGGPDRILVPASALFERGALTGVYVVADGKAWLRWISLGEQSGDRYVVRAGLSAGENVVIDPRDLLDGSPVRIVADGRTGEEA